MYFSTALIFILIVLDILVYYLQKQLEKDDTSSHLSSLCVQKEDHCERKWASSLDKQCRVFSLAEIKLATHDFDDALVIGKGGFGKVYKGTFDFWAGVDVAIKRSNIDSNQGAAEFWAEIEMLSKFRHSHIVSLLGYCEESVLCGRPALDFSLDEQQHSLAGWAKQCIREGNLDRIIDPDLRGEVSVNCLKEFGQIAYECLRACSKDRPTMTKVLARLEFVLAWTLRNRQSASDPKYIGRAILIEKAWSLFSIKAPFRISSDTKILGQSNGNKKKDNVMEKQATTEVEIGCHIGEVATLSQQVGPPNDESKIQTLKEFTYFELRIATSNFRKDRFIGEGGFGEVFKGWVDSVTVTYKPHGGFGRVFKGWVGSVTYKPQGVDDKVAVAVKRLKPESLQGLEEWQAEIKFLGKLSHPNLVKLFGYCWENKDYFLVYEYMQKGSLENHLFNQGAEPLPWYTRIKIATGAAQGLAFLHSSENNIICRDNFNAKLSDFGLSKLGPDSGNTHVSTRLAGTSGYMAPEYIATGRIYIKSDVYAFGMVMLEIITGLRAWNRRENFLKDWARPFLIGKKRLQKIMDPRLGGDYPTKDANKIAELILTCLQTEPRQRPSMKEVVSELQGINENKSLPSMKEVVSELQDDTSSQLSSLCVQKEDHCERKCASSLDKQCRVFSLAEIKLATHDFDDALVIGKGGFGKVYKGTFDFWAGVNVAIKRSNIDSNQGAAEFWAEIEMLSKFRHSHIVSLLGYCEESVLCGRPALDFSLDEQQHSLAGWAKQCIREGNLDRIIDPDLRGEVSVDCLKEFGQIAYECLRSCSKDRPTMTKVLARLEFVLAWTLRSRQSASDRKHIGRAILIEKAWSLFSIKAPFRISSDTKILGQSNGNKKKDIVMEKQATTEAEIGCHIGEVATVSQQVVPPNDESKIQTLKEFTYFELRIATSNFRKDRFIGEGGFGEVFKGWVDSVTVTYKPHGGFGRFFKGWVGNVTYKPQGVDDNKVAVAVKRLKPESLQGLEEWQAEIKFLGKLSHPNLVKLFGYCWENKDYFLVYEYMQKGSLENHLFNQGAEPLPWYTRIKIATGAAQGLAFLHSSENNIICRDNFNAKLSDFGLSKLGPDSGKTHVSTRIAGTSGYMAPEYIATGNFLSHYASISNNQSMGHIYIKSDVYAFGMVMLEIITGLRAWNRRENFLKDWARPFLTGKKRLQTIMDPRLGGDYPTKDASKIAELILTCLQTEPRQRPSMKEVVLELQGINENKSLPSMKEVVSELQGINENKIKPRRSKAKTRQSSDWHQQNHRRFPFGTKPDTEAWSTRSWLSVKQSRKDGLGSIQLIQAQHIIINCYIDFQQKTSSLLYQQSAYKGSSSSSLPDKQSIRFSLAEINLATNDFNDAFVIGNVGFGKKQLEEDDGEQRNSSQSSSLDRQSVHKEDHCERKCSSLLSSHDKRCRVFSLAEIKLATQDFDDALVIGKGGFGMVYKGKFDFWEGVDVAIKRSNLDSNQGASEFWAEIEMLSKFRHSHIVSLLGYCEDSSTREMILVYEYMPNGSLDDHLHKRKANGRNSSQLTWVQRLNICIDAARGLDYLHTGTGVESRVIHRDVKSSNILLDEKLAAKISDFGVSRIGPAYQLGTTNVYTGLIRGTFGYMDAEYFSTHRLTRKSDVYAFGVVLLETLCGRPALDFTLDEQQHSLAGWAKHCIKEGKISQIIDPCLRGQVSANCLKEFGQIAYECLLTSSKDRPTMTKVLSRLEFVLAWTLRSLQSTNDQKHNGRTTFIEKAWLLLSTKSPVRMSSDIKRLGQNNGNKKRGKMMEKHVTSVAEIGCPSGGVVSVSQQVLPPSYESISPTLKEFTYSELRTATRNFRKDMVLGEGGFGRVYKGWLNIATQRVSDQIAVAIKQSKPESLQGLKEWQSFSEFDFAEGAEPLSWCTRIKVAMGAAQGLAFLHSTGNNVIYRDMKPSNILLDGDFNAKLSDFGLAKLGPVNGESHVSTQVVGTYGYAAPEYIATDLASAKYLINHNEGNLMA
ncbi:serine/threonine/dual specificity protein kinase, catalytic domain-containing protein [Artemisia annua]|uniref:Serine/threonine/dual specificity protein kinase, catalytic domain-containing protein n=1 Tax=Artemisia annua TaxID=35608 RepID=A0A2U1LI81_ARTAN|nr:serine/threonine/dual specificity protein kinase, catalytic domain-containing protein [Artemisia annua]